MKDADLASKVLGKTMRMMKSSFWPKKASAFLHGEMFILNYLTNKPDDATPSKLANAMNASTARIAMALRSLERKGLIQRRIDNEDRRKVLVSITELGFDLVKSEHEAVHDTMVKIIQELGEDDTREFMRIVDRITEISERANFGV